MIETFQANCLATLIGSLPLTEHGEASDLIMEYTPEIPFWAQLPAHKKEGMMVQFTGDCRGSTVIKATGLSIQTVNPSIMICWHFLKIIWR
jgi:hypothetical protein